jgi:hypothetical protein
MLVYQKRLRRLAINQLKVGSRRVLATIDAIDALDSYPEVVKALDIRPTEVRSLAALKRKMVSLEATMHDDLDQSEPKDMEKTLADGEETEASIKSPKLDTEAEVEETGDFERIARKWEYDLDLSGPWQQLHRVVDPKSRAALRKKSYVEQLLALVIEEIKKIPENLQKRASEVDGIKNFDDIIYGFEEVEHDVAEWRHDELDVALDSEWITHLNAAYHQLCDFADHVGVWVETGD